jgi:hypothetical protein
MAPIPAIKGGDRDIQLLRRLLYADIKLLYHPVHFANSIPKQAFLPRFQEFFRPEIGMDILTFAQFGYADFIPEPFEYDTYLFSVKAYYRYYV